MTQEQLLAILKERNVQVDEESPESVKSNLIEIYRKTVLPLSQRTKFQIQLPNLGGIQLNDESKKKWSPSRNTGSCYQNVGERLNCGPVKDVQQGKNSSLISLKPAVKRNAEEVKNSDRNPTPKKREKITWP